jgi:hypothetical protein
LEWPPGATNVKKPARTLDLRLLAFIEISPVSIGQWLDSEILVIGELKMGAFLVVGDDEYSLEFRTFDSLLSRKGGLLGDVVPVSPKLNGGTGEKAIH